MASVILQASTNVYKYGERGSGFRSKGEVQDFRKIRERCLKSGSLFEDPDFPACDSSIYYSKPCPGNIKWKRPSELCDEPHLFVEGATRFDVLQGELGDCWLLAAVGTLTLNYSLLKRVIPLDQSFVKDYAGVFHFRFWQYGRWVDIVIDDRLPTRYGQLVFMHSKTRNEFWSALLEKAYAKLNGSYEALSGGFVCEAMEDFTGGVGEVYDISKAPSNLYKILLKAYERESLISCAIDGDPNTVELKLPNGLVKGHAYSITKVLQVYSSELKSKIPLLRIRNPWGNSVEWKGAWCDRSLEWSLITAEEKKKLGLKFDYDGEFWISFKDFLKNFHRVDICNLSPDSLDDEVLTKKSKKKWEMSMYEGSWTRSFTAGGCLNFLDTFWKNPQFSLVLEDVDEDDDDGLCTVIVALMQKNRRRKRKTGQKSLSIGFTVYQLKNPDGLPKPLHKEFFGYNNATAKTDTFINSREVSKRFKLPPGTYCIVPSTFNPNEEGDFVIRVFTEKRNIMTEHDVDIGITKPDDEVQTQAIKDSNKREQEMKDFFASIAGEDKEVDCYELQQILNSALKNEFKFDGFSLDVCRSMVSMMDIDLTGKLGLEEFMKLWTDIFTYRNAFKKYDEDQSGLLSIIELKKALLSVGYQSNYQVLRVLILRYGKNGKICFEDFIMCAVKLKTMIEIFYENDPRKTLNATFTLNKWVEKTMYS